MSAKKRVEIMLKRVEKDAFNIQEWKDSLVGIAEEAGDDSVDKFLEKRQELLVYNPDKQPGPIMFLLYGLPEFTL